MLLEAKGPGGSWRRGWRVAEVGLPVLVLGRLVLGWGGAGGLPDQVRQVRYTRADGTRLPAAALVRPDGYLAWASDERDASARATAAGAAVRWWCG